MYTLYSLFFFFFQAEDGIRDLTVTGVQTCALPILLSRANQHGMPKSAKLLDVTNKRVVKENCRPVRCDFQFYLRSDFWILRPRILLHGDPQNELLSRLHHHFLLEVLVASLTHRDFMFPGQ